MKTIFCALWLAVLASGCSYFRWGSSDRPWTETTAGPSAGSTNANEIADPASRFK